MVKLLRVENKVGVLATVMKADFCLMCLMVKG